MCGIIGYTGHRPAVPIILSGLRRVEYRGYDSAGLAIHGESGNLVINKRQGKINEFAASLEEARLMDHPAQIGIGHTRWATHGEPSDANAHPHLSCRGARRRRFALPSATDRRDGDDRAPAEASGRQDRRPRRKRRDRRGQR